MIRIHATLHKCLTLFYLRVMESCYNRFLPGRLFAHYESIQGLFYNRLHHHRIISSSGFAVDPDRLDGDFRIVRFVRDPRDMIVSGYYSHRRGAEPWFRMRSPSAEYWQAIAGNIPEAMPHGVSYAEYLQSLDTESGLIAEIEFRAQHLQSLRRWRDDDERIHIFRYEDILGNERAVFEQITDFYELGRAERYALGRLAGYFARADGDTDPHIRNPSPGQWIDVFTPDVANYFDANYGDVIERLGY